MWSETDREIMRDVYRLLQGHADPDGTKAYWDATCGQAKDIYNKYRAAPLAFHMVSAAIDYLGEVEKARFRIGPGRDEVDGTEPRISNEYELEVS